jgi:outer membrane protein
LQLKEFYNFDVKDETDLKDENNILAKTPLSIYENAKEQRTEIKIARTQLEMALKDLAIAKGGYQPTLNAFFSYDTRISYNDVSYVEGGTVVTESAPPFWNQFEDNAGKSFGASLSIPIFNGFTMRNNVDRAKVEIERRKIALEQEDLNLQRNVYTAYTDALGALKGYESAVAAVESRQGSYDYAKEKYDVGLMNSFDFFQSQSLLTNAQSEVLRTKYDYIFKIKILEFYFGIPISQIMQN